MTEHIVAEESEIPEGERVIVEVEGKEIGVFNVKGEYYAVLNWCVHQGGPCCEGTVDGTYSASFNRESLEVDLAWVKEDEILSCPWHGWEYDLTTGECLSNNRYTIPQYPVHISEGEIIVDVS